MFKRYLRLVLILTMLAGCGRKPPYVGRSVAELERMLDDPNPTVQVQGAHGLSLHGEDARPAIPALARALKSSNGLLRQQAALALGEMGAEQTAIEALMEALHDAEWTVRRQAAVSLGKIGPAARAALAPLQRCREDENTLVRKAAERALSNIKGDVVK